jgi:hypothetical protein
LQYQRLHVLANDARFLVLPTVGVALTSAQMQDLQKRLSAPPNGRRPRGLRHRQETVLSIGLAAVLAVRRGYTAIAEWAADLTQA